MLQYAAMFVPLRLSALIPLALALLATVAAIAQTPPAATVSDTAAPDLDSQRLAAQRSFVRLMEEQRHEEAVTVGTQVLALTTELHGAADIRLATPLINLGTANLRLGNLADAAMRYESAITLIEEIEGVASPRLVDALIGLAESQARGQAWEDANRSYSRALTLSHAANGLYSTEQLPILDGLSETWLGMDRLERANDQQEAQFRLQKRRAGERRDELVPAYYKLGRWYNRTGQYAEARGAYQSARRVIRDTKGADHPDAIDALLGEAESYEREGAYPQAAIVLRRALELANQQPASEHLRRAEILLASGDLGIVARLQRSALRDYAAAWAELSADPALGKERDSWFAEPVRLTGPELPRAVNDKGKSIDTRSLRDGPALQAGQVLASMTITPEGRARDVVIQESDPPGLLDRQVLQTLEFTAFRPRLVDGVAVATENHGFRHGFRYPLQSTQQPVAEPGTGPDAGEAGKPLGNPGG